MADSPLIIKSKEFALQIIKVCNFVKQTQKGERSHKPAYSEWHKCRCKYTRSAVRPLKSRFYFQTSNCSQRSK